MISAQADGIALVMGNLNTHKKASLYEALEPLPLVGVRTMTKRAKDY